MPCVHPPQAIGRHFIPHAKEKKRSGHCLIAFIAWHPVTPKDRTIGNSFRILSAGQSFPRRQDFSDLLG
jgi:hypothetical protein